MSANLPTGILNGSLNNVSWTKIQDNTNSFDGTTFTAPVTGNYSIAASLRVAGTWATNSYLDIQLYLNGSPSYSGSYIAGGAVTQGFTSLSVTSIKLNKGDTIVAKADCNATTPTYSASTASSFFQISLINPGSQRLAASETVKASYASNTGQATSDGVTSIFDFEDKISDSHNAVTTGGSWKFTAPISGSYLVSAFILTQNFSFSSIGNVIEASVYKNGSYFQRLSRFAGPHTSASSQVLSGNLIINLLQGDYIDLRFNNGAGVTVTSSTGTNSSYIDIVRQGN